jgi:hypothetical protein
MLYPTKVDNNLTICFHSDFTQNVQVDILSVDGQLHSQQNFPATAGDNTISLTINNLKQGLYYCRLKKSNEFQIAKFIK